MKLAEALQERADLNRKIEELTERIKNNCLVQEDENPDEDPNALLNEFDSCIDRLRYLMTAINNTNNKTVSNGRTLTEIIAEKDAVSVMLSAYRSFVAEIGKKTDRARYSEIKIVGTMDIPGVQKKVDALSKKLRELDNALQQANWLTELIEK